jgi:hypothetical protein
LEGDGTMPSTGKRGPVPAKVKAGFVLLDGTGFLFIQSPGRGPQRRARIRGAPRHRTCREPLRRPGDRQQDVGGWRASPADSTFKALREKFFEARE